MLGLAIASWFACGCLASGPAIFLARAELDAIDRGVSSPAGKGMVQAGFWIAAINLGLYALVILVFLVLGVVQSMAGVPVPSPCGAAPCAQA